MMIDFSDVDQICNSTIVFADGYELRITSKQDGDDCSLSVNGKLLKHAKKSDLSSILSTAKESHGNILRYKKNTSQSKTEYKSIMEFSI